MSVGGGITWWRGGGCEVGAVPILGVDFKAASEAVHLGPEVVAEVAGEGVFGDDVDVGGVLEGFGAGVGGGVGDEDAAGFEAAPDFVHQFDEGEAAFGGVDDAGDVLDEVVGGDVVEVVGGVWDWFEG